MTSKTPNMGTSSPPDFDRELNAEMTRINARAAALVALLGALLTPAFSLTGIDYLFAPHSYLEFLLLRLGMASVCFIIFLLVRSGRYDNYAKQGAFAVLVVIGWGVALMIRQLGYDTPYYAGLNLLYLATMLIPWGMRWTLVTCLSIYAAYLFPILVVDLPNIEFKAFINNNQFQIFTITVAAVVNHFQFQNRRREILNRLTIAKQAKELEERDEYKREFIANITHELKTPLAIVTGNADLILGQAQSTNQALADLARVIQQAAFQLATHVDRIIKVSTIDDPEYKLDLENFDYIGVVQNAFALFETKAADENITFTLNASESPLVVNMDVVRVEEVLHNLIQNAFKFTEPGGKITVSVGTVEGQVFTEVSDTGTGIPEDKLEKIFERLYQADQVLSRRHEGIGLGLYICKKGVEAHGGTITVNSKVGKGTTFRFTLPLHIDQSASYKNEPYEGPERRRNDRRDGAERRGIADRRMEARRKRFEYHQNLALDNVAKTAYTENIMDYEDRNPLLPSVLLVEDNVGMMKVVVDALRDEYNLFLARDGFETLEKLQRHAPRISLILSDIMMPGMSGFEFCTKIMERDEWKHIPLVFVTALSDEQEHLKGYNQGATDYITKPYNVKILKEKIAHWISRRHYEILLKDMSNTLEAKVGEASKINDIVMHEIRNPLQVITGAEFFINRLNDKYYQTSSEDEKRWWESVTTLRQATESIMSVMETSKQLEGERDAPRSIEPASTLLNDALAMTRHLVSDIEVINNSDRAGGTSIRCNKKMLDQVFVNLLRNAAESIRETHPDGGGRIEIDYEPSGNRDIHIRISDNGTGIDPEVQSKLFRFKYTTKKDGTGVGLHLSKMILKLHGGSIAVESEPGRGSTFIATLPVHKAEPVMAG